MSIEQLKPNNGQASFITNLPVYKYKFEIKLVAFISIEECAVCVRILHNEVIFIVLNMCYMLLTKISFYIHPCYLFGVISLHFKVKGYRPKTGFGVC